MGLDSMIQLIVWTTTAAVVSAVALTFALPTGRSWIRQVSKRAGHEAANTEARLTAMQDRISELEERVDFAERMLARQREPDRLEG
jgi:transposase-like protein